MGISYTDRRYTINGQLLSENPVMGNLEKLCNSCGVWLTYDTHQGKWSVIINQSGASTHSFDNTNIIGPINLTTTGIDTLYNVMKATYAHEDLSGQTDFIQIELPLADRFDNESLNTLDLTYDLVTDPVQAQLLGFIELKQSRVDKVITFRTDYSKLGIKAGDIIDVTNDVYSFVAQKFRVISTKEVDADGGSLDIEILALEYDESVYDESNLNRYIRSDENGIIDGSIIPAPRTPDIIKFEEDVNPRITATTSLSGGLVDEVEFWITDEVPPTQNDETLRTYSLLTTTRPPTSANVFSLNESITVEVNSIFTAGNFLIKCRAKNAFGVSDFSDPSGLIWNPVNIVDPNANIDGNSIHGNIYGNIIGNLFGNSYGTHHGPVIGNVTGNINGNVYGNVYGNVIGPGGTTSTYTTCVYEKSYTITSTPNDLTWHSGLLLDTWTPTTTGNYLLNVNCKFGGYPTTTIDTDGCIKVTQIKLIKISDGSEVPLGIRSSVGSGSTQLFEDQYIQAVASVTAGTAYSIAIFHLCDAVGQGTPATQAVAAWTLLEIVPYTCGGTGSGVVGNVWVPTAFTEAVVVNTNYVYGDDLDIRARIIGATSGNVTSIDIGQDTSIKCLGAVTEALHGYQGFTSWPTTGTAIMYWAGDNTDGPVMTEKESILIDITAYKAAYPAATGIIMECYANWHGSGNIGGPVDLTAHYRQNGTFYITNDPFDRVYFNSATGTNIQNTTMPTGGPHIINQYPSSHVTNYTTTPTFGTKMGYFVLRFSDHNARFTGNLAAPYP